MADAAVRVLTEIEQAIAANRVILPSLPEVAWRVRDLCREEEIDLGRLEREISKDAAIAARIVKIANSSAMQRGGPVSSLRQAISRLGLTLIRSLVTQLAILQTMQQWTDASRLQGFVASGLQISALCHSLARGLPRLDPEQAALAGLVHDIGKLPLRAFLKSHADFADQRDLRHELEHALHPQVGALLLEHWRFFDELVQAVREHEDVERDSGPQADYGDVVIAANLLHYGTESGRYAHLAGRDVPALRKCVPPDRRQEHLRESVEQRMALSLQMIAS